jgi:starvation-inducible outer membrane lipoprotein
MIKQDRTITFFKVLAVSLVLIALIGLTGCASKPKKVQGIDPIANAKELGKALGCVFAPNTCKSKEQIKKEQDEITKDFNKVDREMKADQDQTQPASK